MLKQKLIAFISCFLFSVSVYAMNGNNPFAKSVAIDVGKDVSWDIDKRAVVAKKSIADDEGVYYQLKFDNKTLTLSISDDAAGKQLKTFSQLEVKDVLIDNQQSPLFKWCLMNQERHSRFLQQGLAVKKDVCRIDSSAGIFVMRLNKATLKDLMAGKKLTIALKPFRTPVELVYDMADFNDMYVAMNAKPAVAKPAVAVASQTASNKQVARMCKAAAPAKYKSIKSVEYACGDAQEKVKAEVSIASLVSAEKAKEKKLIAEREKQLKIAEEKKLAEKLALEKQQEEAAILAASAAKQAQLDNEITAKMIGVCNKFWTKGEHRCYCQKYIDHAPSEIQANSSCN